MNERLYKANIKLLDENTLLKDDKEILGLKIEGKDKVINELLSKIAKLEYEVERLNKELEIEKDISDGMLETIDKAIEFIYENAYDEERENCIDDLWGEIPKLLKILKGER